MQKTTSATPLDAVKVEQRPDGQADIWLRKNIQQEEVTPEDGGEPYTQYTADEAHIVKAMTQEEAEADFDELWDEAVAAETPQDERIAALEVIAKTFTASASQLAQIRTATSLSVRAMATSLTDDQVAGVRSFLRDWKEGEKFEKDEPFNHDGKTHRAAQDFTGQSQYEPGGDGLESLFYEIVIAPDGIIVWQMPKGGHDCPNFGDKRHYPDADGPVYVSKRDGNTSVPGTDEWWVLEE